MLTPRSRRCSLDAITQLVAASYERTAPGFSALADRLVYRYLAAPLARVLARSDGIVLDVATGTGALGRELRSCVGVDVAFEQLSRNSLHRLVCADAEHLPFRSGSFAAAGSAFGINHFPHAATAVAEMARVAPVVGLLTWERPERVVYEPKQAVLDALSAHTGAARTEAGRCVDDMSERVGSEAAIRELLESAGLSARVETVAVEVPWPGTEQYVEFRLAMHGADLTDEQADAIRRDACAAIDALDERAWRWRPRLIRGIGTRGH